MSRPPLDLTGRACSTDEFHIARQIVARSGVVATLAPYMDSEVGRHRRLSLEGLLVAFQINALQRDHQAHLIEAARILNGLDEDYRRRIGIENWDEDEAYARVTWLFAKLCKLLKDTPEDMDAQWFANRLTRAAIRRAISPAALSRSTAPTSRPGVHSKDLSIPSNWTARLSIHN